MFVLGRRLGCLIRIRSEEYQQLEPGPSRDLRLLLLYLRTVIVYNLAALVFAAEGACRCHQPNQCALNIFDAYRRAELSFPS